MRLNHRDRPVALASRRPDIRNRLFATMAMATAAALMPTFRARGHVPRGQIGSSYVPRDQSLFVITYADIKAKAKRKAARERAAKVAAGIALARSGWRAAHRAKGL